MPRFLLIVLAVIGTGTDKRLDPTVLDVPGTESSRSNALLREHFGESAPFAILLRGPGKAIDRQGPELVAALREDPRVTTLSPWDTGSVQRLRPKPSKALIIADFHVDTKTAVNESVPHLERLLEENIHPPVNATQTGYASLSLAIQEEGIDAAHRGELIALPFLLIILLLVFRSPIAAAIPLAFGAVTVVASRGVLYFFTGWFEIDALGLVVCSMMGLALGRRLLAAAGLALPRGAGRGERAGGGGAADPQARRAHGLLRRQHPAALDDRLAVHPPRLAAGFACVDGLHGRGPQRRGGDRRRPGNPHPAGPNVNRWRIGRAAPVGGRSRLMTMVGAALKRPALATVVIAGVLLVLAAPVIGLKTGPPSPEQLPTDSPAREDAELVDSEIGQGFDAPFQMIAVSHDGPITDAKNFGALENFQRQLSRAARRAGGDRPGPAVKRIRPLQQLGNSVLSSEGDVPQIRQLARLGRELNVAAGGVGQLREGISEASDGAGLLALGSGRAAEGAQLIANGLGRATSGSQEAIDALERFAKGRASSRTGSTWPRSAPSGSRSGSGTRSSPTSAQCPAAFARPAEVAERGRQRKAAGTDRAGADRRSRAEGRLGTAGRDDGRQNRPQLRGGAGSGAESDRGGQRQGPGYRRPLRPGPGDAGSRALRRPPGRTAGAERTAARRPQAGEGNHRSGSSPPRTR